MIKEYKEIGPFLDEGLEMTDMLSLHNSAPSKEQSSEIITHLSTLNWKNGYTSPQKTSYIGSILKGLLYVIALNSGIASIAPAKRFSLFSNNIFLSYFFPFSIYISIGSVSIWSVKNFLTYVELCKITSKTSQYSEIILGVSSLFLGVITTIPGTIMVLRYNSPGILPLSLFADISANSISFNELFRQLYNDSFCYRKHPELFAAREILIKILQYGKNHDRVEDSDLSPLINYIQNWELAISVAFPKLAIQNAHPLVFKWGANLSSNFLGICLPLSWWLTSIYLVYSNMYNSLGLNKALAGIIAISTTFPNYFLEYYFAKSLINNCYMLIANKIYDIHSPNPLFKYYPTLTTLFLILTIAAVSGSFSARAQLVIDLFKPGILRNFLLISVSTGTLVFKVAAAINNLWKILNFLSAKFTSHEIFKQQLLFDKQQLLLRTAQPEDIQDVVNIFPQITENFSSNILPQQKVFNPILCISPSTISNTKSTFFKNPEAIISPPSSPSSSRSYSPSSPRPCARKTLISSVQV